MGRKIRRGDKILLGLGTLVGTAWFVAQIPPWEAGTGYGPGVDGPAFATTAFLDLALGAFLGVFIGALALMAGSAVFGVPWRFVSRAIDGWFQKRADQAVRKSQDEEERRV
jgi:hypothetical protein